MSEIARQLANPALAIWLELSPPSGIDMEPLLQKLELLDGAIGAVNLTDNAMGRAKLSSLAFGMTIKQRLKIPVVLNVSCRDRNLLALKSDLLAAAAYDIDGVVALRGDRLPASAGFEFNDLDAIGLLHVIDGLKVQSAHKHGAARTERSLYAGAVTNPYRADPAREFDLLARKAAAGARFALTQPCFDAEQALRFIEQIRPLPIAPVIGLLPIRNAAMARYLKNRVRELKPVARHLEVYDRMREERVQNFTIAQNLRLIDSLRAHAAGFVIMSGGEPSLAIKLAVEAAALRAPITTANFSSLT
ncbi:MAG TPA: methylenetetrahydrofolate reductase [Candidatus Binataceae bacterium]|nr:methylenetetrahydrofolate reductase [Candidatus Binataceae bacterium]